MTIAVVHRDSPEGRAAIVHAGREAHQRQEQLVVLHVLDDILDDAVGQDTDNDLAAVRAEIQTTLESIGAGEADWELRAREHRGDPATALRELVEDSGSGLLVVGTRRMSAIGKFLLERWLQRLLLEVDIPILVVKEELHETV